MTRTFTFKFDWLLLFILLVPTYYVWGMEMRQAQMLFFQDAAIFLLAFAHINKYIGGFLFLALVQTYITKNTDLQQTHLFNLFFGAIIYQFIVKFMNIEEIKKYWWAFCALILLNLAWCGLQHFQIDPIFQMRDQQFQQTFTEYSGFFALPAFLGNYVAPLVPVCLSLNYFLVPAALLCLVISKSSFSLAAAYFASLFYYWFRKRLVFWILLIVGGAGLIFYAVKIDFPTGQFTRRLKVWKLVTRVALMKQWIGYGLSNYRQFTVAEVTPTHEVLITNAKNVGGILGFVSDEANKYGKPEIVEFIKTRNKDNFNILELNQVMQKNGMDFHDWKPVHNDFLEVLFEMGIFGLLIVIGYLVDMFRRFWRYGRDNLPCLTMASALVAIIVVTFGHFPFHIARLAGPYVVLLAIFEACLIRAQQSEELSLRL